MGEYNGDLIAKVLNHYPEYGFVLEAREINGTLVRSHILSKLSL